MYKWKKIESSLLEKGFVPHEDGHLYLVFYYNGKATLVRTKLSHGSQEPGKDILSSIKKQLKFKTQNDFEKLIDCPMSREQYEDYLKKEKYI